MPPELMELYNLYKQELETRSTKENQFVEELNNEIIRVCECKIALNLKCIGHTWANSLKYIKRDQSMAIIVGKIYNFLKKNL